MFESRYLNLTHDGVYSNYRIGEIRKKDRKEKGGRRRRKRRNKR